MPQSRKWNGALLKLKVNYYTNTTRLNRKYVMFVHVYLMQELIQRSVGHVLSHDAEELGLITHTKDLDDVVKSSFVKHLCFLQ